MATNNTSSTFVPVGLMRLARIVRYDLAKGVAVVKLSNVSENINAASEITIGIPSSFSSNSGVFAGGLVDTNTPVVVALGEGGKYHFVSFLITSPSSLPTISSGSYLISTNKTTKIVLDNQNNINIGSDVDRLHLDTKRSLFSLNVDNKFSFTEASRNIEGIIKRDLNPSKFYPSGLKLKSDDYDKNLYSIGLDPKSTPSNTFTSSIKNPEFVEKRELVYEFAADANVQDDLTESFFYKKSNSESKKFLLPNRRESRSDTLSLSLLAPNFLMETVKGTVVDIFGNILDINRSPIPIGSKNLTLRPDDGDHIKDDTFNNIKAAERKSIAFHFELNARKDLTGNKNQIILPDIRSNADYARNRSRFFFDIDKEGLFKLNVPSSSETGNIPLLTRYENYSSFGEDDNSNPNKLFFRDDNLDIFQDSFAVGSIDVKDGNSIFTPLDRIKNGHIKHGTPYHSISGSCGIFQNPAASGFLDFQYNQHIDLSSISTVTNIVSPVINVSGTQANAGGRSGSINFDGSLEWSIGANTVDRQSLWLDTAGGIIANIGRDKNFISGAISLDGDLLVQIGGYGITTDSRFKGLNNSYRGGALDIRVLNDGFTVSIIRIDRNGITVATPGTLALKGRTVTISAEENLILEGDNVSINDRPVKKFPITSI